MKLKILNLTTLFLVLTMLAAWWITASVISPFLQYHFQQTAFITSSSFFEKYTAYPGGMADYIAEFFAQYFSFNTFGSFLIVAVASLQGFIALNISSRLKGNFKAGYSVFALILLFSIVVLCDYRYPYYASIRLLFAFIFTWIFCILNIRYARVSIVLWLVFAGLLFYMAGGPALFVFALATGIIIVITNKQRLWLISVPVFLVIASFMPYFGYRFIFSGSLENIYTIILVRPPVMLAYTPEVLLYIYYSLLPAIPLIVLFFLKLPERSPKPGVKASKNASGIAFLKQTPFLVSVQVLACFALGYFLFMKSYDPIKKKLLTIEYYAENEQWNEVLKTAKTIKDYDFKVNFHVNRALSHLGQLPDRLFEYPQLLGSKGLFIDETMAGSVAIPTSDLYFDLGFMSESLHWAFEAQTLFPDSPRILKRLVMINLVNRKYNLAGKFLNILDENMLYHDWVRKYEQYISDTTLASADKLIAEKRRFSPQKELVNSGSFDGLKLLVETNKDNRMAYDYLLTFSILDSYFPQFVDNLQYFSNYNIKTLPRSWEEALALYIAKTRSVPPFVTPEMISQTCIKRFTDFNRRAKEYKNNVQAGKDALFTDYGDTFWYYILYLNPKVTNILQNKMPVL